MLKRRRKDIDNKEIHNKNCINNYMDSSSNNVDLASNVNNFLKIFIPSFIQNIEEYRQKSNKLSLKLLNETDQTDDSNIFNQEFLYHISSRDTKHLENINYFQFNNYVNDYKLLSDRVLQFIFEKTFENLNIKYELEENKLSAEYYSLNEENEEDNSSSNISHNDNGDIEMTDFDKKPIINILKEIRKLLKKGFGSIIYKLVINHQDVGLYFKPIIENIHKYCQTQLDMVDNMPYIEQKTKEWFEIRENMISASVCGYLDSEKCKCGLSKETEQVKEKSYLKKKKHFSWNSEPLKHGQQFEDLSAEFYQVLNNCVNKEYGILTDPKNSCIGASPDGLIIKSNDDSSFSELRKKYRMLEIKNPYSRLINHSIPSYYYYQMQQQMYVCALPYCDFIQTQFKYPKDTNFKTFKKDSLNQKEFKKIKTLRELSNMIAPYIINNFKFRGNLENEYNNLLQNVSLINFESEYINFIVKNFDKISPIPLNNLTSLGFAKGILWCFTKEIAVGDISFKIEYTPLQKAFKNIDEIDDYYKIVSKEHIENGYVLEDTHYWRCEIYDEIEVEYNKGLYEGYKDTEFNDDTILKRLKNKWNNITELRNIQDIDKRAIRFYEFYPNLKNDYSNLYDFDSKNNNNTSKNNKTSKKFTKKKFLNNSKNKINCQESNFDNDDDIYDLN